MEVLMKKLVTISKLALLAALATSSLAHAAGKRPAEDDGGQHAKHMRINPTVTLVSSDEENFEISKELAMISGTLQNVLQDSEDPNQMVPLPYVSSATLPNLIECLEIIHASNGNQASMQTRLSELITQRNWSAQVLEDLLLAANFLDIPQIIDAVHVMHDQLRQAIHDHYFKDIEPKAKIAVDATDQLEVLKMLALNLNNLIDYCHTLTFLTLNLSSSDSSQQILLPHFHLLRNLTFKINQGDSLTVPTLPIDKLEEMEIIFYRDVTTTDIEALAPYFKVVTCLKLEGPTVTDATLQALAPHLGNLKKVSFMDCNMLTTTGFEAFAPSVKNITFLWLSGTFVTDAILIILAPYCSTLEQLDLSYCNQITNIGLETVALNCGALKELHLSGRQDITFTALIAFFANSTQLTRLSLGHSDNITDTCLATLAPDLHELTSLELTYCGKISDRSLRALAPHLNKLKRLRFQGINITDIGLTALAGHCSALDDLIIACCPHITGGSVEKMVQSCTQLIFLHVSECNEISKAEIEALNAIIWNRSQKAEIEALKAIILNRYIAQEDSKPENDPNDLTEALPVANDQQEAIQAIQAIQAPAQELPEAPEEPQGNLLQKICLIQ
jgi:hypothetical protein